MDDGTEMDVFCGSKFWDSNLTWYTDTPDLTPCFERTVLVWTPCALLWAFSSLELFYLINSKDRNVPWNVLNLSKLALTGLLIVLCLADFGYAVDLASRTEGEIFNVHYYTPFILIVTFILAGVFLVYNKKRGMTSSGLLFFFWLLLALCGAVQFYSEINRASVVDDYSSNYFFISYMIYYPLVLIQFFLHCFADQPPIFSEFPPAKNPCPEYRSSAPSRLVFAWFDSMAWLGFKKPLEPTDLWSMNAEDTSAGVVPEFDKYWNRSVEGSSSQQASIVGTASFRKRSGSVDLVGQTSQKKSTASITGPLCKAFGPAFLFGAFLKLINDTLTFVNPHILELLIGYIEGDQSTWKGYLYAALMLLVASCQTIVLSQYFYRMMLVGMRTRTALISAIYRKSLRLSNESRKESTVGEIVNLMSVDAQRFMELTTYLNMIWSAPLQIALALYFLWDLLGPSVLAGLAVMIILIPINGVIANKTKVLQMKQMKNKDDRVKMMNEVLSGIKVLKLYAWEPSFEEQILKIRNREIKVLKQAAYLNAATSFIWSCAPFLVSVVTLGTFVLLDPENQVTAQVAFVSLNYFNLMRFPMSMLPQLISFMIQVGVVTLGTFVLLGGQLSPTTAFVSLSYFHLLRFPMMGIPMLISFFIQICCSTFACYVMLNNPMTVKVAFVSVTYFIVLNFPLAHIPMLIAGLIQICCITFGCFVLLGNEMTPKTAFVSLALFGLLSFPFAAVPYLVVMCVQVSLVSFATYVMSSEENILDSKRAFVALSLFNILRFPLSMLPMMISQAVQASVSVKRINKFLNSTELDPADVTHDESDPNPLVIENGSFSWGPNEPPTLKGINISLKPGQLAAVVGTVGSGKSSLVSALLGEMDKLSGKVNTKGAVAYVPQQAWIQNATLRDNVLFGKNLEHSLYTRVIDACALKPDLEMLPGGDQTEIGEKGINLSGGQKQRVSLARAVYANSDVYFLDDPLSAVDSHVGKHIFDNVIGPSGILRKKTRLLVTHGITYLPEVDVIFVLKDGEVSEIGTYKELLERKGAFAEFLIAHLQESAAEEIDLEEIKTQLEGAIGEETFRELQRQRSETRSETGSLGRRSSDTSVGKGDAGRTRSGSSVEKEDRKASVANGAAKPKDKLIETEKAETGSVKWDVYSHYLSSIGIWLSIGTLVMNLIYQGFSIGSNVWLSAWSDASSKAVNGTLPNSDRDMYLGVYGALGLGQAVSNYAGSITVAQGSIAASLVLHNVILTRCFMAPMSFFDTTPIGRIVNRFAKDVDTVDNVLPMTMRAIISQFFSVVKEKLRTEFFELHLNAISVVEVSLVSSFLAAAFCFASQIMLFTGALGGARRMHVILLRGVLAAPVQFFDVTPTGRLLSRFSSDIAVIDEEIPWSISDIVDCTFQVIATLVVISYTTPIFIAVILPIGVLYYLIQRFYVATSRQLKRIESVSRSPIYSHFGESVTGAQTIRAYGVQQRFIRESENRVDFNQVCLYPSNIANRWLAVRLEMIGNLIIFFAALFAVLNRDTMNPGLVGLSVTYALQITQTLNWLVRMTSDVETNIVAVERIKEYGETPQEAAWEIPDQKPPQEWPSKGEVEFQKYQVRYREGLELVLKGIDFSVKGGEKVGIVGRTGAGKSSLTLGLFRIIEAAGGNILIDGRDISKMGLHDLRTRLTIIPQDPVLFSGTLRLNLDPFRHYNDQEVWKALEHAHLKSFVSGLTLGLEHEVSEGGENLSVGQRQLVCLARALLRKTKVLILDEATAAVDLETDDLIQRTIRSEFKDCTVLTIAHRLNTIMDSDRVVVLDKGLIVEYDNPQTLLSKPKSVFAGMAKDAGITAEKKKA